MLVVDESSNFKNGRSVRFRLLKQMVGMFSRRVIMTGSPAPNGLKNLWSQIYLLDAGDRLGRFVTHFYNRFFYASGYMGYEHSLQPGADTKIYSLIGDIVMHKSRDLLDMPGLVSNIIRVELPPDAREAYNNMKREMVADIDGEEITAVNAAVKIGKLQQMANGAIYGPGGNALGVHTAKIDALKDLHEELEGRPLLVFYNYLHDLAQLNKAFPGTPALGGHTKHADAQRHIDEWNRGELPLMFLHPASAAHGLNLQTGGCTDVCFFSIPWDRELYDQATARVWRQGVKSGVTVHHIVGEGTIDDAILGVLWHKHTVQEALLTALVK
jgi:SNF2 family DNA or RNA helicase